MEFIFGLVFLTIIALSPKR